MLVVSRRTPVPLGSITKISVSNPVPGRDDMKKIKPFLDYDGARLTQSLSASPGVFAVRFVCPLPSAFIRNNEG